MFITLFNANSVIKLLEIQVSYEFTRKGIQGNKLNEKLAKGHIKTRPA